MLWSNLTVKQGHETESTVKQGQETEPTTMSGNNASE